MRATVPERKGASAVTEKRLLAAIRGAELGLTIPELADHFGCQHNTLYRKLPRLAEEGFVRKEGRRWIAVPASP